MRSRLPWYARVLCSLKLSCGLILSAIFVLFNLFTKKVEKNEYEYNTKRTTKKSSGINIVRLYQLSRALNLNCALIYPLIYPYTTTMTSVYHYFLSNQRPKQQIL